ncbi:MAG: MerR family transcriptional regulator [Acidimicrobiales bacterium]|jgi:DNA-binding transcriptional MerR regulator
MLPSTSPGRLRVEELSRRLGLSVDTIRFYQKRGLLEPPQREGRIGWYGPEHVERLAKIKELQASGLTLAVIARVLDGELDDADLPLAAVVARARVDQDEGHETLLTLGQLAEQSGVPVGLIDAVVRENLLVPRSVEGVRHFTDVDVRVVQAGLALLSAGIPLAELMELARRHDHAAREIAEGAVELFDAYVRRPLKETGLDPDERAEWLVQTFDKLLSAVTTLVSHHFRRVLLEIAQQHLESVGRPAESAVVTIEAKTTTETA